MPPRRVDSNQPQIVAALRKVGCSVQHLHELGKGCPDILVGYHGRNYLLEIKSEEGSLTVHEHEWHTVWRGQVATVRTVDQALYSVGAT